MASNINGDLVAVKISTALVTPVWKEIICGMNTSLDGSVDVTKKKTKCGTLKSVGPADWNVSGTGTHDTAPGVTQISAQEMIALFQDGTEILVQLVHATDDALYYRQGSGFLSKYAEKANVGDSLEFDFGIEIEGDLILEA